MQFQFLLSLSNEYEIDNAVKYKEIILDLDDDGVDGFLEILKNLDYPKAQLSMDVLEKELLKFSNNLRLQDDLTIIEVRFAG